MSWIRLPAQFLGLLPVIVLASVIFVIDILTPHGFAEGMLYMAVVLLATRNVSRPTVIRVAIACSLLTVAGYLLSPLGSHLVVSLANRSLTIGGIWAITLLGLQRRRAEEKLHKSQEEYQQLFDHNPYPMWVFDFETLRFLAINQAAVRHYGYSHEEFMQLTIKDIRPPEDVPDLLRALQDPGPQPDQVKTTLRRHRKKDGTLIDVEVAAYSLDFSGRRAKLVLANDVSDRKRAEEATRGFIRLTEKLNSTLNVDKLLRELVTEAVQLVNARDGCAGLRTDSGLVCHEYFRAGEWVSVSFHWAQGCGLPGWVLTHKVPYLTNQASTDSRVAHEMVSTLGIQSALVAPILDARSDVIGFVEIDNSRDVHGFTENDQAKLMAVSQAASTAIQNALAYQKIQQADEMRAQLLDKVIASQEEERRRIARELHDEIGQSLTSLLVRLRSLYKGGSRESILAGMDQLRTIAAQTLNEVQRLALGLRPIVLDDLGLEAALNRYAAEYQQAYGIPVDVAVVGLERDRLPTQVETALYRIAQEALTNAAKHAAPKTVSVLVQGLPSSVHLVVEDDGCGFVKQDVHRRSPGSPHLGLYGMEERVTQLKGVLMIETEPGKGTTIRATIPLPGSPA